MNLLQRCIGIAWTALCVATIFISPKCPGGPFRFLLWREPLLGCFSSPIPGYESLLYNHRKRKKTLFSGVDCLLSLNYVMEIEEAVVRRVI